MALTSGNELTPLKLGPLIVNRAGFKTADLFGLKLAPLRYAVSFLLRDK